MPRDAANCRHRAELVDDVAWNEIDVVVPQLQISIVNAFTSKLVQFSIINPCNTLHINTQHKTVSAILIHVYACALHV